MTPSLFEQRRGSLPVLISFPHSGTFVPGALRERFTAAGRALPDTDWFVPELYRPCLERLDVHSLIATHSRYVVDLNRPADGSALYPGRIESGVCPTETFAGDAIYQPGHELTLAEMPERIERHWRPYHAALAAARDEILASHGHCLLWDAHSIRSQEPRLFEGLLPELNLGTFSGRSAGTDRIERVAGLLKSQPRFSHVVDGRFKGGYITRHYGDPAGNVHAMQLEIAQRAYLSEADSPYFDSRFSAPLSALIERLISTLLQGNFR
ncbi:MAG TPA: N-formylglutamate amidohydrolase [Steroidobacteraceae bacterium]|nr:N-formylglutamate amidohydrolase [Steroidobacteraceae bacterium]